MAMSETLKVIEARRLTLLERFESLQMWNELRDEDGVRNTANVEMDALLDEFRTLVQTMRALLDDTRRSSG